MTWWKEKAWPWLKKWGGWILGALVAILTLGLVAKAYKGRLGKVKDELAIAEATKEIGKLQEVRAAIEERVGEKDEAIDIIDHKLAENRRRIIEAHEGGEDLTDDEVLEEYAHLGI
tara:strand:+ start:182 stop:529 length:348 start_codon:yes stop_codon:yes gene_type:complete